MSEPIQPVSERPRRGYRAAPARGGPGVGDATDGVHAAAALGPFAPGAYAEPEPAASEPALGDLQRDLRAIRIQVARAALHPGEVRDELARLRQAVERIEANATAAAPSASGRLRRMLEAAGLEGRAVAGLAREVQAPRGDRDAFRSAYRDAIARRIRVRPWPLASTERQVVAVVGPPGVGKTTTVAKLAARALFEHDRRVALVTCDTYRVGAIDHIWRYASLLGVELSVARDARELREAVASARADIVLVDTTGRGPTEGDSAEGALATLADHPAAAPIERRVLLCLPAEVRAVDAEALVTQFAPYKPTELVVTKLDLTRSPGGLLHGMLASGLAVSAICVGQRVPEDIQPATAGVILDQLTPKIP